MRYRIPLSVIRYSPILLYILIILISDSSRVECFTRPTPPSQISIQKGSSNLVSQCHHQTSTSLQKKQLLYATADENNDGETIVASSPSNEQQPTTTKTATRKQPTLAELEDLEEARLAQQEEEEATKFNNGPSNLYNDVYSVSTKSISRIDNSGSTTTNKVEDNNEDPLNISPQTEIRLAKARDTLQNTRLNEMFAEEDLQNLQRQQKIQALMDEDDKIWKEERRKKMMGKYADVDSWEEVEKMLLKDRKREVQGTFLLLYCVALCIVFSGCIVSLFVLC